MASHYQSYTYLPEEFITCLDATRCFWRQISFRGSPLRASRFRTIYFHDAPACGSGACPELGSRRLTSTRSQRAKSKSRNRQARQSLGTKISEEIVSLGVVFPVPFGLHDVTCQQMQARLFRDTHNFQAYYPGYHDFIGHVAHEGGSVRKAASKMHELTDVVACAS